MGMCFNQEFDVAHRLVREDQVRGPRHDDPEVAEEDCRVDPNAVVLEVVPLAFGLPEALS